MDRPRVGSAVIALSLCVNGGCPKGLAEDEGFEPSIGFPIHAFQACALGRYANSPGASPKGLRVVA